MSAIFIFADVATYRQRLPQLRVAIRRWRNRSPAGLCNELQGRAGVSDGSWLVARESTRVAPADRILSAAPYRENQHRRQNG